ncbi:MAG: NAD-dependent epimerase/dehydratase family protein [Myxococcota bacterium]|nr:NAD-dependent epimerase/dehydratase family protein [Myxococcota bacterium]
MNLLITGISGAIGQAVVKYLTHHNRFGRILAIDRQPPSRLGPCHFIKANLNQIELADILITHDIQCVIHLAGAGQSGNPRMESQTALKVLKAAAAAGCDRVVIPSRDWVYRSSDEPSTESAPLRVSRLMSKGLSAAKTHFAARLGWAPVEAKLLLESVISNFINNGPACGVVVPRFCTVLSDSQTLAIRQLFDAPFLLSSQKNEPRFQFLHIDDAARFLITCAHKAGLSGAYNVAGHDQLTLTAVAGILEKRIIHLPNWIFGFVLNIFARLRLFGFSQSALVKLQLATALSVERASEVLGKPTLTSRQALALWRTTQ